MSHMWGAHSNHLCLKSQLCLDDSIFHLATEVPCPASGGIELGERERERKGGGGGVCANEGEREGGGVKQCVCVPMREGGRERGWRSEAVCVCANEGGREREKGKEGEERHAGERGEREFRYMQVSMATHPHQM